MPAYAMVCLNRLPLAACHWSHDVTELTFIVRCKKYIFLGPLRKYISQSAFRQLRLLNDAVTVIIFIV